MTPLPEAVMKYAPWSYSKASDALTCPLKFHKRYILKERATVPEARETTVGTVVHKILEWTDMGMTIEEAFRKAPETMDFTYEVGLEVQTFRGAVEEWVRGLAQFCEQNRVLMKYPEKKVGLDQHFMLTGYDDKINCLVRGKIDLTLFTGHRRGVVIDHKSGALKKIDYHQDQLELYSIMADALVKGLISVRAALHFIGADKNTKGKRTSWLPEYSVEVVRTRFVQKWTDLLIRATEVAENPDPQPKACWLCNFCGYTAVCPLKA